VTRPLAQAAAVCAVIVAKGGEPLPLPLIATRTCSDLSDLDRAVRAGQDWWMFTSANAVRAWQEGCADGRVDARARPAVGVACVGRATAQVAAAAGLEVRAVAPVARADGMKTLLTERLTRGTSVLWPRGAAAERELANDLRDAGLRVDDVCVYETCDSGRGPELLREMVLGRVDAILFYSPSAVRVFAAAWNEAGRPPLRGLLAAIGPVTAAALRAAQLPVALEGGRSATGADTGAWIDDLLNAIQALIHQSAE
jgi:uroporphyrinogen III methyltransferase/synthase